MMCVTAVEVESLPHSSWVPGSMLGVSVSDDALRSVFVWVPGGASSLPLSSRPVCEHMSMMLLCAAIMMRKHTSRTVFQKIHHDRAQDKALTESDGNRTWGASGPELGSWCLNKWSARLSFHKVYLGMLITKHKIYKDIPCLCPRLAIIIKPQYASNGTETCFTTGVLMGQITNSFANVQVTRAIYILLLNNVVVSDPRGKTALGWCLVSTFSPNKRHQHYC